MDSHILILANLRPSLMLLSIGVYVTNKIEKIDVYIANIYFIDSNFLEGKEKREKRIADSLCLIDYLQVENYFDSFFFLSDMAECFSN